MLGVFAPNQDPWAISQFFEHFKTPWEPYNASAHYQTVLSTDGYPPAANWDLLIQYSAELLNSDEKLNCTGAAAPSGAWVEWPGVRLPLYGKSRFFQLGSNSEALLTSGNGVIAFAQPLSSTQRIVRVGYDLFAEIAHLLSEGQPQANARSLTLEHHVTILHDLLTGSGQSVVEIPPRPEGYRFMACLTHDVDHPSLRKHFVDHTALGYLKRATLGSISRLCHREMTSRECLQNWGAAASLPLVYARVAPDPWNCFQAYRKIEAERPSTFFFIPEKARPGRRRTGSAPPYRAVPYGAADFKEQIDSLQAGGAEVGLHGLDAWLDPDSAQAEGNRLRQLTGKPEIGVRMHWLYFDKDSPTALDQAGFSYDSTWGYNGAVGYRSGGLQPFQPKGVSRLLELPLNIMDTSLLYPAHMALSRAAAVGVIQSMISESVPYGGCMVINWHDRSLAPERLWGNVYAALIRTLHEHQTLFASALQAVDWFRSRRAMRFERVPGNPGCVRIVTPARNSAHPNPVVVVHPPRCKCRSRQGSRSGFLPERPLGPGIADVHVLNH